MNKIRINWVDVGKGIGMILVVLAHVYKYNPIREWIYSFHVPLFFFLSGYVFEPRKYIFVRFLKKRIYSLIIPYFIFAFLSYLYWLFIARNFRTQELNILTPIYGFIYGNLSIGMEPNRSLWFLPCLFVTSIVFFIVSKHIKNPLQITGILIVSAICNYYSPMKGWLLPWGIDSAFAGIVFYGLGYLVKEFWGSIINQIKPYSPGIILTGLALLIVNITSSKLNGSIVWGTPLVNNNNIFYYYTAAVSGVAATVILIRSFRLPSVIIFIGVNSIVFMFLHQHIKRVIVKTISVITHLSSASIIDSSLSGILITFLIMVGCVPFILFMNKCLPIAVWVRDWLMIEVISNCWFGMPPDTKGYQIEPLSLMGILFY